MGKIFGRVLPKITLNEYISQNITRLGLTNAEIAKKLGVEPAIVTNWRRGDKEPGLANACKLAQLFGVSLDEFYDMTPNINLSFDENSTYLDYISAKEANKKIVFESMEIEAKRAIIMSFIDNINDYINDDVKCHEIEMLFENNYVELKDCFDIYISKLPEKKRNNYFSRLFFSIIINDYKCHTEMAYAFMKYNAVIKKHEKTEVKVSNELMVTISFYSKICQCIKDNKKYVSFSIDDIPSSQRGIIKYYFNYLLNS